MRPSNLYSILQKRELTRFRESSAYVVSTVKLNSLACKTEIKLLKEAIEHVVSETDIFCSCKTEAGADTKLPVYRVTTLDAFGGALKGTSEPVSEAIEHCKTSLDASNGLNGGVVGIFDNNCNYHELLFVFYSFVIDPAGLDIFVSRVLRKLNYIQEQGTLNPKSKVSYLDFSNWLEELEQFEESKLGRQFWEMQIKKGRKSVRIPWQSNVSAAENNRQSCVLNTLISSELTESVCKLSNRFGVAKKTIYLYAWILLQEILTDREKFLTFVRTSVRDEDEFSSVVGVCDRIIPIAFNSTSNTPVLHNIESLEEEVEEAFEWQECYEDDGTTERYSLFSYSESSLDINNKECVIDVQRAEVYGAFELLINIIEGEKIRVIGAGHYWDECAVNYVVNYYIQCLQRITSSPISFVNSIKLKNNLGAPRNDECHSDDIKYDDLSLDLSNKEKKHRVAIETEDTKISYEILAEKVESFRWELSAKGVSQNHTVMVNLPHSVDLVVAILAVVSLRSSFVGIPIYLPEKRINAVINEADVDFILSQGKSNIDIKKVDKGRKGIAVALKETNEPSSSVNLAYKIFTSGTSGIPKAIEIEREALELQLNSIQEVIKITSEDKVLLRTNIGFDAFIWELLLPLKIGATLVLPARNNDLDTAYIENSIAEYGVTVLQLTPTLLRIYVHERDARSLNKLRALVLGGEKLCSSHLSEKIVKPNIYNVYGPSEACIQATAFKVENPTNVENIPIGKPLSGYRCKIFDKDLDELATGLIGELCIASRSLFSSYCNRPVDTKKCMFTTYEQGVEVNWYRTGDLARFLPNGNLEYIDRMHSYIKVNGYRISTSEIEMKIIEYDGISQACVIVIKENNIDVLFAVYQKNDLAIDLLESEIKAYLDDELPYYMIPKRFIELKRLPTTPNGKLDVEKIKKYVKSALSKKFVSPRTETEIVILQIWEELVGTNAISIYDNFYMVGGHSLLFSKLIIQLNKKFILDLTLTNILKYTTIADLARYIDELTMSLVTED